MEKKKIKMFIFTLGIALCYCLSFSKIISLIKIGGSNIETSETSTFFYPKASLTTDFDLPWVYSNGIPIYAGSGNQQYPQICSDDNGGAIIVWLDSRGGSLKEIYAQRIDYRGISQWTDEGVLVCTTCEEHEQPQICSDGKGGVIITWMDDRSVIDIYAQYINSSGDVQWIANGISICTGMWPKEDLQICSDGEEGAIITWIEDRDLMSNYQIYAQKVNSSGVVQWNINGELISTTGTYNRFPQLCSDQEGGAIITWIESVNFDIYARYINFEGVLQSLEDIPICTENNAQLYPKICSDENGGAIITWQDHRSGNGIYAQRINSNGDTQWINNGSLISDWSSSSTRPEICPDGNSGAIITWSQDNTNIYVQRINFTGDIQWATNGIPICLAIDYQQDPQIASDGNEGAFITWNDHRNVDSDIYAQQVNSTGHIQGPTNGFPICIALNVQAGSQICSGERGNAIITWFDDRFGTYDIFGQKIRETPSIIMTSPRNKTYSEPMDGYYPATYGFESFKPGDTPVGPNWDTLFIGIEPYVMEEIGGHRNVVYTHDNRSGGSGTFGNLEHFFNKPHANGSIEWWWYIPSDYGSSNFYYVKWRDSTNTVAITLGTVNDHFQDSYGNVQLYETEKWYHHRIIFDCETGINGQYSWYIDGILVRSNQEMMVDVNDLNGFDIAGGGPTIGAGIFDAFGYSWDLNYNVGDNLNEGILLSFETPIDFDSTSYSLDGQDTVSIIGNTVLPMLIDGSHTIKVLGNDSLGYLFQSKRENFAIDTEIPELLIHSPNQDDIFGMVSPKFNISIIDENQVSSWYTLDDGVTNISFTVTEGYIDQDAWSAASNGAINITFYVKDIGDHLIYKEITVIKRVTNGGGTDEEFPLSASILITALSSGAIVSSVFILWERRKRMSQK